MSTVSIARFSAGFPTRMRAFMTAIPPGFDAESRLVLVCLFSFADEDGGGIYVGTETICAITGLPRRTVFRRLGLRTRRLVLIPVGGTSMGRVAAPACARSTSRR